MQNKRNWKSEEILKFAEWLWDNDQRSYSILAMHGVCWGIKIGNLLKMKWSDIIENDSAKNELNIENQIINISPFCQKLNLTLYKELKPTINNFIHVNKTGKLIDTSNLSKNLQRLSEKYSEDCDIEINELKPLIGSSFQIAWIIDMLEFNHYSKNAFIDIAKYLKKKSVKDLEDYVGLNPKETQMKFDLLDSKGAEIIMQPKELIKGKIIRKDFSIRFNN
jgi:hypothetical protein